MADRYEDKTEIDAVRVEAFDRLGSKRQAALELGCSADAITQALRRSGRVGGILASPARDGGAPYVVKGVSTYFDGEGNQRGQWVKTTLDSERRDAAIKAAYAALDAAQHAIGDVRRHDMRRE